MPTGKMKNKWGVTLVSLVIFLSVGSLLGGQSVQTAVIATRKLTGEVSFSPFAVKFSQPDSAKEWFLGSEGDSALFIETEEGVQYFEGAPKVPRETEQNIELEYKTTDGRKTTILISGCQNQCISVQMAVEPEEGVKKMGAHFKAYEDEHFFGLLERVVDGFQQKSWEPGRAEALDLRGQKVNMFVKPTVSLYTPFYLSTYGYGVFVSGTWPGDYDLAATDENLITFSFEGPDFEFTVIPGPKPMDVVKRYTDLTGKPILPPKWVFTPWRWRNEHINRSKFYDGTLYEGPYNSELVEDILLMEAYDIPCGAYWVDRPWALGERGYSDFIWHPERFPNAEEMIQWLKSKNIRFLLWIAPWTMGEMNKEAFAKDYAISGKQYGLERALIDFTNPEAVAWWQEYIKKLIDQGVVGFKLDRAEEIVPSDLETTWHNGKTAREVHNDYPRLYLKATHDILKKELGNDFVAMPRAGYAGSQKYGIFWGGDIRGTEWGLRAAIIAVQRAAGMGFPFWGSDTGGYHGGCDREVIARWLGFSCFCPLMEVGPTENRGLWNMPYTPGYDDELIATWRLYAKIHQNLLDYTYAYAKISHAEGAPIVRPMYMAFPDDPNCATLWEQYMYGEDILVGLIWEKGQEEKEVYVPEGRWIDAWDKSKIYEGGKKYEFDCPFHKIPILLREGSKVNLGNLEKLYDEALAEEKPDLEELQKQVQ